MAELLISSLMSLSGSQLRRQWALQNIWNALFKENTR